MTRIEEFQKQLDGMASAYRTEGTTFDIRSSWRVFRTFVEQLTDEQRAGVGVEIENHESSPDVLWAEWRINVVNDDNYSGHVGFLWFREVTPELLGINQGLFYWPEREKSLEDFWRQVEAMPAFQIALSLDDWKRERIN